MPKRESDTHEDTDEQTTRARVRDRVERKERPKATEVRERRTAKQQDDTVRTREQQSGSVQSHSGLVPPSPRGLTVTRSSRNVAPHTVEEACTKPRRCSGATNGRLAIWRLGTVRNHATRICGSARFVSAVGRRSHNFSVAADAKRTRGAACVRGGCADVP